MKNRKLRVLLTVVMILAVMSVPARQSKGLEWLKDALFYQIYPSSFMDSDGMVSAIYWESPQSKPIFSRWESTPSG